MSASASSGKSVKRVALLLLLSCAHVPVREPLPREPQTVEELRVRVAELEAQNQVLANAPIPPWAATLLVGGGIVFGAGAAALFYSAWMQRLP